LAFKEFHDVTSETKVFTVFWSGYPPYRRN
jgi:hypothetical protein